jgi:transposase
VPTLRHAVKEPLLCHLRRCRQAGRRLRYLIVLNLLGGRRAYPVAEGWGVHHTTVYRLARRFREQGEGGLLDGREDNGAA